MRSGSEGAINARREGGGGYGEGQGGRERVSLYRESHQEGRFPLPPIQKSRVERLKAKLELRFNSSKCGDLLAESKALLTFRAIQQRPGEHVAPLLHRNVFPEGVRSWG